jgi:hypothetical protein
MKHTSRHDAHDGGFVLLMALLVVAVVTTLMAGAARQSLGRAMRAGAEAEKLQLRWGQISGEKAVLELAPRMIDESQRPGRVPRTSAAVKVTLGGMRFELLAADENAKVQVNAMYDRLGKTRAARALAGAISDSDISVQLEPYGPHRTRAQIEESGMPLFGSFGEVVTGDVTAVMKASERITCWSNGKVNIRRATPEAIRAACTGLLDGRAVQRIVAGRAEDANMELGAALHMVVRDDRDKARAEQALTDRSMCYSVWTTARGAQRTWYRLAVAQVTGPATNPNAEEGEKSRGKPMVQMMATFDW